MQIFRLIPKDMNATHWKSSTWNAPVLVRAPSEAVARMAVTLAFSIAVSRQSGAAIPQNPWRQPELVICEVVNGSQWPADGPVEILDPPNSNDSLVGIAWDKM